METPVTATTLKHDIVPAHLAVQAMRDNGYKNAAYAIAELIDNSIQAGATRVELLCGERTSIVKERQRRRIQEVAVLDNGSGMSAAVLRMALQFGNGTHLTPDEQEGIGKFGMGLPSSSISQCRRVDVWSWQDGPESALYSYLDLNDIIGRVQGEVPEPTPKAVPKRWRDVGHAYRRERDARGLVQPGPRDVEDGRLHHPEFRVPNWSNVPPVPRRKPRPNPDASLRP